MKFHGDLSCFCSFSFNKDKQLHVNREPINNTCTTQSSPNYQFQSSEAEENISSKPGFRQICKPSRRLKRRKASSHVSSSCCSSLITPSVQSSLSSDASFNSSGDPSFTPKSLLLLKRKASNDSYYCNFCIERKTRRTTLFKQIDGFNAFSNHMIKSHSTLVMITGVNKTPRHSNPSSTVTWSKATDLVLKPKIDKLLSACSSDETPCSNYTASSSSPGFRSPPQDANTQTEDEEEDTHDNPDISASIIDQQITEIPPDIDEWFQNVEIPDSKEYKDAEIQTDPMICHCGSSYIQYEPVFPISLITKIE